MKRLLALALVLISAASYAQNAGTVTYERKINMHRRINNEEMKARIPEFNTSKHLLLFSDSISLYKVVPENEGPDPFDNGGGGGMRMVFRMAGADGSTFKNFASAQSLTEQDLGDKSYIIVDSIAPQGWKLSEETKTIMGVTCKKATMKTATMGVGGFQIRMGGPGGGERRDTTQRPPQETTVVAWYAESIPTPAGPDRFSNLPGLIMEVDVNNGEMLYTVTDIKRTVDAKELKEPKKGKRISRQEFSEKQREMFRNMQMGGGGQFRING